MSYGVEFRDAAAAAKAVVTSYSRHWNEFAASAASEVVPLLAELAAREDDARLGRACEPFNVKNNVWYSETYEEWDSAWECGETLKDGRPLNEDVYYTEKYHIETAGKFATVRGEMPEECGLLIEAVEVYTNIHMTDPYYVSIRPDKSVPAQHVLVEYVEDNETWGTHVYDKKMLRVITDSIFG